MSNLDIRENLPASLSWPHLDEVRREVLSLLDKNPISPDQQKILLKLLQSFPVFGPLWESSQQISGLVEKIQNPTLQKVLQKMLRRSFTKN